MFRAFRPLFGSHLKTFRHRFTRQCSGLHTQAQSQPLPWVLPGVGAAVLAGAYCLTSEEKRHAEACGIVGYIGEESAVDFLLEGLHILQNRGYDSAGITTVDGDDGTLKTSKFASVGSTSDSIEILKAKAPAAHKDNTVGIAHTRWATHGGKTDDNAHPHADYKDRIALVHNGTIENFAALKQELQDHGIPFKSATDTEVIANLIGFYLDQDMPLQTAAKKAFSRLEGTWGIVLLHKDNPGQLLAVRNGSPLVVGIDKNRMFVASELSAFSRHTRQYIPLEDGEMAVINKDGISLDLARIEEAPKEDILLSPEPYPHWTQKEIMEQPEAIARTLAYGARFAGNGQVKLGGLDNNKDKLLPIRNLLMAGCGTSFFAILYGAQLMRSLNCFDTVQCWDASEVTQESFPDNGTGGLCVVSQSGETKDTHRWVGVADSVDAPVFSVVNQVGSLIARTTNCGVYLNAGREHAVASTKAFSTQVTAMALIAGWFAQNRQASNSQVTKRQEQLSEAIHRLPIYAGITLRNYDKCKEIAKSLSGQEHVFILGKGFGEPIAREGALKIKELSYVHAEGYGGGALKHGPFALLQKGTPVILLILDDQHRDKMRIAAQEVRARGAHTIVITDKAQLANDCADDVVVIPSNGPMTALLATLPIQIMAYEMSVMRGHDPDKPRNLAKAVTVD